MSSILLWRPKAGPAPVLRSGALASTLLRLACTGVALGLAVSAAQAGAFAVREQSAYGQGASYAGIAAGGALSSMYYNPATLTRVPGIA